MEKPLQRTVALVTGASSGIGAATARRLADEGAAVALVARRRDRLDELASMIDGHALVVEADVTDQAQAAAAVARTVAEFGRLDTLVNNAGVMLLGPALDSPTEEWDRMIALNVQGSLYVTKSALPHLVSAAADSPRRHGLLLRLDERDLRQRGHGFDLIEPRPHANGAGTRVGMDDLDAEGDELSGELDAALARDVEHELVVWLVPEIDLDCRHTRCDGL